MGKVQMLPDQVANQIAAGEVVERPASVVKELVENSMDAGATRIEVEIQAGGRNLIRVTDNGSGMNRDDALMCLERHATSKLKVASDLVHLTSFGFRGEAIPSIASVSYFSLTTRESDEESGPAGTQILIDGGKILNVKDAGHPPGTTIEVRQLFFNVPARKKFLRTPETERAHIQEYLLLVGLSNPQITLTYIQDHKRIFHLPAISGGSSIPERINQLQKRWAQFPGCPQGLVPVYHEGELPMAHPNEYLSDGDSRDDEVSAPARKAWLVVWGLIGKPGESRSTRADQHLFVNRRPVDNRTLNTAILEGYHTAMPKGRYPVGCLFLELDPAEVDVNIHPAKKEVKFHRERAVRQVCCEAVREALFEFATAGAGNSDVDADAGTGSSGNAGSGSASGISKSVPSASADSRADSTPQVPERKRPVPNLNAIKREYQTNFIPTEIEEQIQRNEPVRHTAANVPTAQTPPGPSDGVKSPAPDTSAEAGPGNPGSAEKAPVPVVAPSQSAETDRQEATLKVPLKVIGMAGSNFILMESDRGLVIMDQRSARARIIYEKLLDQLKKQSVESQRLLLPETFELSSKDAEVLREHLDSLNAIGVGVREFGDRAFVLEALPPVVKSSDARRFAVELIDRIRLGGTGNHAWDFGEESVAREMALQAVSQAPGISENEIALIIRDLRYCRMPYTSPDGRPTLIEMSMSELDRKFGIK